MTRDDDAVLLRHEKSNLGPLQGEIKLEFDPYAKVFREFGTIPGKAAAVSLMRNQQRGAILRLIDEEAERGANLSMSMQAPTNVWAVIRDKPGCPHMPRRDFFALLNELERSALVKMEPFVRSNRTTGSRLVVTDAGRALARSEQ
jgi:hypothetical protein